MVKKNLLWSMLTILMVTMLGVGITACGSDSDDGDNNSVAGTWSGSDDKGKHQLTLVVNPNGTGNYVMRYFDSYSGTETESGTFTYVMEGSNKGVVSIRIYDSYQGGYEYETLFFVIEGKTMYLYDDDYYGDLEWVLTKQ